MEDLPLHYIVLLLTAAIIIGAILYVTGVLTDTAIEGTNQINSTLYAILDQSLK